MLVFILVSMVLTATDVFFSTDGGSKYILTRAFLEHDPSWPTLPYPGRQWDPSGDYFPIREAFTVRQGGYYVSAFPIYFPMLSSIGLRAFGFRGLYAIPLLAAFLSLWLTARLGRLFGWSRRMVVSGILLLAFATPFGFYASTFWEHVPAVALLLGGMVLLLEGLLPPQQAVSNGPGPDASLTQSPRARRSFLAGLLLGLAAVLRVECAWTCAALLLALLSLKPARLRLRSRGLLALAGGMAAAGALLAGANVLIYGLLQGPQVFSNLAAATHPRMLLISRILAGRNAGPVWMGLGVAALLLGMVPGRIARSLRLAVFGALLVRVVQILAAGISPGAINRSAIGALETSPFLFLVPLLGRDRPQDSPPQSAAILFGRTAAWSALAVALTSPVDGGLQGGSRLLLPSIVFGLIAVLSRLSGGESVSTRRMDGRTGGREGSTVALEASGRLAALNRLAWERWALVAGLVLSLPLSARAFPFLVHRTNDIDHPALVRIRQLPGDALVYNNSAFPQGLAVAWWDRPSFIAVDLPAQEQLFARLAQAGAHRVWLISWLGSPAPQRLPASSPPPPSGAPERAAGPSGPPAWVHAQSLRVTAYQCDLYIRS